MAQLLTTVRRRDAAQLPELDVPYHLEVFHVTDWVADDELVPNRYPQPHWGDEDASCAAGFVRGLLARDRFTAAQAEWAASVAATGRTLPQMRWPSGHPRRLPPTVARRRDTD